jgi:16S rRNA (guanine527-N7)-methyltransferase
MKGGQGPDATPGRHTVGVSPYSRRMLEAAARADITALAAEWACPADAVQIAEISSYFALLLEWNARVNLTGAKSLEDLIWEHLPDALALGRLTPARATVVDVGAGGGLPGVPFALLRPDCRMILVEPRAKRAAFLRATLRSVGRPEAFQVVRGRDKDLPSGSYDVAESRATFAPADWLDAAARLLAPGGRAVVFTSAPLEHELAGFGLRDAVSYMTRRGAARWAGAYVPRGTGGSSG